MFYDAEDFVCLVLEHLRGGELFEYLSVNGPLTESQAKFAIRRVLLALQEIHAKGIVHRDLKVILLYLFIYLFICLFSCLSVCLVVCFYLYLFVCLFVYLFISLLV